MRLISSLKNNRDSGNYPFHMPGHKRRLAGDDLLSEIYGIDISEIEGFDDLHNAEGILKNAQEEAAVLFGADEAHYLVNGSTGGLLAAIVGTVKAGEDIIIASNCHRSVYNAVMLTGAGFHVIDPETEESFATFGGIAAGSVESALSQTGAKAVVITSPTYEGITSDVGSIARICHEHGAILIVDAAHGAHFGFSGYFPESAMKAGADIAVTSVHKTLPAMTQTALLLMSRRCPGKDRVRRMLQVFMTSSPSYVLMASIDSMTGLLSDHRAQLFNAFEKRLDDLYSVAEGFTNLVMLRKEMLKAPASNDHDKSKIVIRDLTGSYSGKRLSDMLISNYGIIPEMATEDHVLLMTTIADDEDGFDLLKKALSETDSVLEEKGSGRKRCETNVQPHDGIIHSYDNRMRAAMLEDDAVYIPVEAAAGKIARDIITVYPPGIPVTIPGERITQNAVTAVTDALKCGLTVTGLKDKEIAVIWESSSI